jgi:hypothetical protein
VGSGGTGCIATSGLIAITGNVTGGTTGYGARCNGGSISVTNGNVTGGSGEYYSYGIVKTSASGTVTLTNVNLVNSAVAMAYSGYPPVWNNSGKANYIQFGSVKYAPEVAAGAMVVGTVSGTVTGTRIDCPQANALYTGAGYYGDPASLVDGTVDMSLYTLISGVVAASWVVTGHSNYVGGSVGTYPTTATSQAAQLATDTAAVEAAKADVKSTRTILGVVGTFDVEAYEAARNTDPGVAYVVRPAGGGPASYKIHGVTLTGTHACVTGPPPAAGEPVVEQIAQAIAAKLATITTANGYLLTVSQVVRPNRTGMLWTPKDLGVAVLQGGAEPTALTGSPLAIEWSQEFSLDLVARVSEASQTPLDQVLNRFESEVVKAVMADPQWGGLAINTELVRIDYPPAEGGVEGVTIVVAVHYRVREADPYTQA